MGGVRRYLLDHLADANPLSGFASSDNTSTCLVCLDEFQSADIADRECIRLRCGHKFHRECIIEWGAVSNTCPTCRDSIV
jgi:predicted ATPase